MHPLGRIPVMRHGDVMLFESKAICAYVDRAFDGPPLIPADAISAALVEQWISLINSAIDPVCVRQYLLAYFFPGTPDGAPDRARIEVSAPQMERQLEIFESALVRSDFLVGSSFTLADAYLLPILFYLHKPSESAAVLRRSPGLSAFFERMMARESVRARIPPPMNLG
ncbi:MAG TPA: glutathione S-transferase family protein [Beijerinckiaceae bacterium]|nr:glutathione S-transferase family protein [Beijerinckiaceae bacterium]